MIPSEQGSGSTKSGASDLYVEDFAEFMTPLQPQLSKQDKIVNAMPFIAFGVIVVLAVVFIFTM